MVYGVGTRIMIFWVGFTKAVGYGDDTYIINSNTFYVYDIGGNDKAIVNIDFVKIPSSIENIVYATGVRALPYWISALLYDDAGHF